MSATQPKKYFDTNIEEHAPISPKQPASQTVVPTTVINKPVLPTQAAPVLPNHTAPVLPTHTAPAAAKNDEGDLTSSSSTDKKNGSGAAANGGSYALKSRNEPQNSFVFNFVNTKKDTSHLEYDGLDLSKRNKKVRIILSFFVL